MQKQIKKLDSLLTSIRVGFFLALRQVMRSSKYTNGLIIFVMVLTFLNLVVVRGILVGLLQGSTEVYRTRFSGDVLITNLPKKNFIENSPSIISKIKNMPWVETYSYRYVDGGELEATYKSRIRLDEDANSANVSVVGIDPILEDSFSHMSNALVEGRYLTKDDAEGIMIGSNLLRKYLNIEAPGLSLLENVSIGDRVRLTVGGNRREFIILGFLKSKVDQIDFRVFVLDTTLRNMIGRSDYNVDEISLKLLPGTDPYMVKEALLRVGVGETARVQTWDESLPKFLLDIQDTFGLLGNVVGSIGLVVASITIFIVIFINAITRRKFIGILKGIGIESRAIEVAYIIQSVFYAFMGIAIGFLVIYGFLVPFIDAHPIRFPFSDGILVAEVYNTSVRALLLMIATIIAGYIPARIVVKKNTLDSILGR